MYKYLCSFAKDKMKYLGHIVSIDGVATDPDKVNAIHEYPVPKTVSEVRTFLGFVGYYRRYIKDFSKMAYPLTSLTRKNVKFVWSQECDDAFKLLKEHLIKPSILAYPQFDGSQFIVQTDASSKGLGFVLSQIQNDKERVIAFVVDH